MRYILALLLLLTSAFAEDKIAPENRNWNKFIQSGSSNVEMKANGQKAIETLDERINEILKPISKKLDEKSKALLNDNQLSWRQSSHTKCLFLADVYRGGTHEGLAYSYGFVKEQVKRIAELKEMKKYREEP